MNLDLLFAIIFYAVLIALFFKYRSRFEVQGKIIALFKTQLGIKWMEKLSSVAPRVTAVIGHIGSVVGFAGMVMILYLLVKGTWDLLSVPEAAPAVALVLPGVSVPGLPNLSFWHWIVAIFIVAVVHEFSHGVWARLYKIKIKSSGFLFFGPILGAFVEPEEKELAKKSKPAQIAVFAAGPFSNVIFGLIFLLIMNLITGPLFGMMYEGSGVTIKTILENQPAAQAGITAPVTILSINDQKTISQETFLNATSTIKPKDTVKLVTDKGTYEIIAGENPDNKSKGFIGVADFSLKTAPKQSIVEKYGSFVPSFVSWINMLVFWLVVMNFGIGLFNLLPLGPIDGGRMFLAAMLGVCKNEAKAKKIWGFMSFFCLLLIFINLAPFLWKIVVFLLKPFMLLLTLL